ncbi:peptidase [Ignicoccus pacificus DSM 13166]|uniref:Peptidase n=1 Tax=Ignicoccus pacificus DSM 13166 TaxID=940294 RepID=A0A977KA33_9CREN|nr:peptidase [Ignicoccus pacificus DSM 13166]
MVDLQYSFWRKIKQLRMPGCVTLLSPENVKWMTGLDTGMILITEEDVKYVVPKLELERARERTPWVEVKEGPRRALWKVIEQECKPPYFADLKYLNFSLANSLIVELGAGDISKRVEEMRRSKDDYEIERMRESLRIAEEAFKDSWEELEEGVEEREAAGILEMHMRERGSQEYAFPSIVAFGESSAHPHYVPGRNKFSRDHIALFDFGAVLDGYRSDITRSYAPEKSPFRDWMMAVLEAVNESIKMIKAGVKAKDVDAKAREVLKEYGLEEAFIHGLGHGVGVEVHEPPYLSQSSSHVLMEGDVVTIEPGVYFPKVGGIRVEQMVLVKKGGYEVLNKLPAVWW